MNIVPFDPVYSSENFECQDPHLTEYLRLGKAKKDLDSGQAAVFLLVNAAHEILGYYTLTSAAVSRNKSFPEQKNTVPNKSEITRMRKTSVLSAFMRIRL